MCCACRTGSERRKSPTRVGSVASRGPWDAAPHHPSSAVTVTRKGRNEAMALWWIGNAVLLLVVAPVCLYLLTGLLKQVRRLNRLADTVLEHGVGLSGQLDAL